MSNYDLYDSNLYVNENCTIHGAVFKLDLDVQKLLWLEKIEERDKVYLIGRHTLVGVCCTQTRVIAYLHTELGDFAFCSDSVMESKVFKESLLDGYLAEVPYDNDWNLHIGPTAELVGNNDHNSDYCYHLNAESMAHLIGISLGSFMEEHENLITNEVMRYLDPHVREWVMGSNCLPIPSIAHYKWEALGCSHDWGDYWNTVLHETDWYSPIQVAVRLTKAYMAYQTDKETDAVWQRRATKALAEFRDSRRK